jgi:hypothetical protein
MAHLHGYELAGEPLPGILAPGDGPLGQISVERAAGSDLLADPGELTVIREDGRGAAFAIARRERSVVVWGRTRGTFELEPRSLTLRTDPGPGSHEGGWAHQLATVAVPLMLAERGSAAIHASGIVAPAGAVLFAGPSGRGKSTTSFLASGHGFAPLADDAIVFTDPSADGLRVFAGGTGFWATPRAAAAARGDEDAGLADDRGSRRIERAAAVPPRGAVRVAAIAVLAERGSALSVERLAPAEALQRLVPSLLHVGDRPALERAFAALASVVEEVPAWGVSMPDRLDRTRGELPGLIEQLTRAGSAAGQEPGQG